MLRLAAPSVDVVRRGSSFILTSNHALPEGPRSLGQLLVRWAERAPDRTWLAERSLDGTWRRVTYAEGLARVRAVGNGLLRRKASRARPVMLLAENGIDAALVTMGAMHAGAPAAPISTAYALATNDHHRLREVASVLDPALIFAPDKQRMAHALAAIDRDAIGSIDELMEEGGAIDDALAAVGPDTIAKVLFTSGSTGVPKGVVTTQRMLCSNQEAIAVLWPFLEEEPIVTVDWLPWSHTFGGSHNFNMVLRNGGTLYVDRGKPAPGLIEESVRNLKEIPPSIYYNVPRGFDLLLGHLEQDDALCRAFFSKVRVIFFAAAALPPKTRARLEACARRSGRHDIFFATAWGSTETAPLATSAHFPTETPAVIGLPAPGTTIELAPVDDKLEIRVKGPNVTPGYWMRGGEISPAVLDEDGFLPTGDAVRFADRERPELGLVFEGRLGENFKLSSGTWVGVGQLRVAIVEACIPLIQDAVIAGQDREELGALLFPAPGKADAEELRLRVLEALRQHNARMPGSSHAIRRAMLMSEPPSLGAGETTDKGYLNQRRCLERRAALVERLFAAEPDAEIIVV